MVQKLNSYLAILFLCLSFVTYAQDEGVTRPDYKNYRTDSTFKNFSKIKGMVAYAQIYALKNGALLVRLKTNSKAIKTLKAKGNIDLATKMERETQLENKIVMSAYKKEFNFCPVYFFYSDVSDSVKKSVLSGVFVDSTLNVNESIICNASFYLIAESGVLYNSSIGIVSESYAKSISEQGSGVRDASIIVKSKYFIQLHNPFPYFQIKAGVPVNSKLNKDGLYTDIANELTQYRKIARSSDGFKQMKNMRGVVAAFNKSLVSFYNEHSKEHVGPEIKEFVY